MLTRTNFIFIYSFFIFTLFHALEYYTSIPKTKFKTHEGLKIIVLKNWYKQQSILSQTKQHKQGQHIPPRVYESLTCFILALSSSGEPTVLNLRLCLNIWARVLASLFCILGRRFFSRACLLCISSSLAVLLLFICSTSYRRRNQ